jgi:hypothetical protein
VCRHTHRYQRSQRRLETVAAALDQDLSDRRAPLCAMPTPQFRDDGLLARKVLIEGCDVDAGALGDPICRQTTGTLATAHSRIRLADVSLFDFEPVGPGDAYRETSRTERACREALACA